MRSGESITLVKVYEKKREQKYLTCIVCEVALGSDPEFIFRNCGPRRNGIFLSV